MELVDTHGTYPLCLVGTKETCSSRLLYRIQEISQVNGSFLSYTPLRVQMTTFLFVHSRYQKLKLLVAETPSKMHEYIFPCFPEYQSCSQQLSYHYIIPEFLLGLPSVAYSEATERF